MNQVDILNWKIEYTEIANSNQFNRVSMAEESLMNCKIG